MKKNAGLLLVLASLMLSGCGDSPKVSLNFSSSEYQVKSGDSIVVSSPALSVNYSFVNSSLDGVNLDAPTGTITFGKEVPAYSQLLYQATTGTSENLIKSDMVVLTLLQDVEAPTLSWANLTNYIKDGDYAMAKSSNSLAVSYSVGDGAVGVSIQNSTGRIAFTEAVEDGNTFKIIATCGDKTIEKEFVAATKNFAKSSTSYQAIEVGSSDPVAYYLDFSDVQDATSHTLLSVMENKKALDPSAYSFDATSGKVTIKGNYLASLISGEHTLDLVTARNVVSVPLLVATALIDTAEKLANINASQDTLRGYYVQTEDIDLTDYLSSSGAGYNDGKGWEPIGTYHDVTDGSAYSDSFKGTYDGAGHLVSGLSISRNDEKAYNAGLFGYVYSTGLIKNLQVESSSILKIRSYCGGLAGANAGTIENCRSDASLSNQSDGATFKVIGSFVGRNEGTIKNSISTGNVEGDLTVGAFVGLNEGVIENCFALASSGASSFKGSGTDESNCTLFNDLSAMKGYDYSTVLSSEDWVLSVGSLPELKETLQLFFVNGLTLSNLNTDWTRGDKITLAASIKPANLQQEFQEQIVYTVSGLGYSISGNVVDTTLAEEYEFIVEAKLEVEEKVFSSSKSMKLYDKATSLVIDDTVDKVVHAGYSYKLSSTLSPTTAKGDVTYSLQFKVAGVSIEGDVLSVSESVTKTSARLMASVKGFNSPIYPLTIVPLKYVENAPITLHEDTIHDLEFSLPSDVSLEGLKAYRYNKEIPFSLENGKLIVASSNVTDLPESLVSFNFVTSDGQRYRGLATYLPHATYDETYVLNKKPSVKRLSSVDDFATYFNIRGYDESKYVNYTADNVYLLDSDIDWNNESTYCIGTSDHPFAAAIYGNGHTITNYGSGLTNSMDNEKFFTLDESKKTSNYRSSHYVIGFFAYFAGCAYDLNMESVKIKGNNYVGAFAGETVSGSLIENVHVFNSKVININEVSTNSSADDHVGGLTCISAGKILSSSYNLNSKNLYQGDF